MARKKKKDQTMRKLKTKAEIDKIRPGLPKEFQEISVGTFVEMSEICPEVYLTGLFGLTKDNFDKYKINNVINASIEVPDIQIRGISYTRANIDDESGQDISVFFDPMADNIAQTAHGGGRTVVHCMAGVSRSTAIVLAYLIKHKKMSLKAAFNLVHRKRQCIKPRPEFIEQLMRFERKYRNNTNSFKMVDYTKDGVTVSVPDFWLQDHMDMVDLDVKQAKSKLTNSNVSKSKLDD